MRFLRHRHPTVKLNSYEKNSCRDPIERGLCRCRACLLLLGASSAQAQIKAGEYVLEGVIRNGEARMEQSAGDSAACRNTLKPWLELAQTPDEVISVDYPPSDAVEMLRMAVATRTNMKLCGVLVVIDAKAKGWP